MTPSFRIGSRYLHLSVSHIVKSVPTACSRFCGDPRSRTSTTANTPPSSEVSATLPSSKPTKASRRAVHFSEIFEDFFEVLRICTRLGIGFDSRMILRLSDSDERFESAKTASNLACGVPLSMIFTRNGIAPDFPIVDLFATDAESVANNAVACSCMFVFFNSNKLTICSNAPASTILILFVSSCTARLRRARRAAALASREGDRSMETRGTMASEN